MNTKLKESLFLEIQGALLSAESGDLDRTKAQIQRAIDLLSGYGYGRSDYSYGYSDDENGGQKKSWLDTLAQTFRGRG